MSKAEIIEELEALASHYIRPVRTPERELRFFEDFLGDLKGMSAETVKAACRSWRLSNPKKFPTPGELISSARTFQRSAPQPMARAWCEVDDDEYRAFPLSEKIRHHTILANECAMKAGPQTRAAEDMPEAWHAWRRRASDHYAEAATLRRALAKYIGDAAA